jgi:hypothetical protein
MMIDREGAPTSAVEGDHRFSHLRKLLKKVGLEAGSN